MDYLSWRATYQDSEHAARRAFEMAATYKRNFDEARRALEDITKEAQSIRKSNVTLRRRLELVKKQAYEQAAELQEREAEVRQLCQKMDMPAFWQGWPAPPITVAFGLSYASWLVLPRVILEAMPQRWQAQLVHLINQLNDRFDWQPKGTTFAVQIKQNGRFVPMPQQFSHYRHPDWHWLESIDRTKQQNPQKQEAVHG